MTVLGNRIPRGQGHLRTETCQMKVIPGAACARLKTDGNQREDGLFSFIRRQKLRGSPTASCRQGSELLRSLDTCVFNCRDIQIPRFHGPIKCPLWAPKKHEKLDQVDA